MAIVTWRFSLGAAFARRPSKRDGSSHHTKAISIVQIARLHESKPLHLDRRAHAPIRHNVSSSDKSQRFFATKLHAFLGSWHSSSRSLLGQVAPRGAYIGQIERPKDERLSKQDQAYSWRLWA